jgi:hypothetical protein
VAVGAVVRVGVGLAVGLGVVCLVDVAAGDATLLSGASSVGSDVPQATKKATKNRPISSGRCALLVISMRSIVAPVVGADKYAL